MQYQKNYIKQNYSNIYFMNKLFAVYVRICHKNKINYKNDDFLEKFFKFKL